MKLKCVTCNTVVEVTKLKGQEVLPGDQRVFAVIRCSWCQSLRAFAPRPWPVTEPDREDLQADALFERLCERESLCVNATKFACLACPQEGPSAQYCQIGRRLNGLWQRFEERHAR
jgi:hypothetical protein